MKTDVRERSRWWWLEKREDRRNGHAWMPTRRYIYRENAELETRELSAMGWTTRIVEVVTVERRRIVAEVPACSPLPMILQ